MRPKTIFRTCKNKVESENEFCNGVECEDLECKSTNFDLAIAFSSDKTLSKSKFIKTKNFIKNLVKKWAVKVENDVVRSSLVSFFN